MCLIVLSCLGCDATENWIQERDFFTLECLSKMVVFLRNLAKESRDHLFIEKIWTMLLDCCIVALKGILFHGQGSWSGYQSFWRNSFGKAILTLGFAAVVHQEWLARDTRVLAARLGNSELYAV